MATIKGQNLRLRLGIDCVAAATQCTLHCAMQTSESSTKDTEDGWQRNEIVGMSWDCSTDQLVAVEDPAGGEGWVLSDLETAMEDKEILDVSLEMTGGTNNRGKVRSLLKGKAVINDINVTAQNHQNAVASIKLIGVGDLQFVTVDTSFPLPYIVKNLTISDHLLFLDEVDAMDIQDNMVIVDSVGNELTLEISNYNVVVKKSSTSLFTLVKDSDNPLQWNLTNINSSSTTEIAEITYNA